MDARRRKFSGDHQKRYRETKKRKLEYGVRAVPNTHEKGGEEEMWVYHN